MDTRQILNAIKRDKILFPMFLGVYPSDQLPDITYQPSATIINADNSAEPGSHWMALFFDKNDKCEFFDSYGRPPCQNMSDYISRFATEIKYNKKCIQSEGTATCGQLCIYYLLWRCRGIPMKQITTSLEKSYADDFVTGFVNNLYKINSNVYDTELLFNQICKEYESILYNLT